MRKKRQQGLLKNAYTDGDTLDIEILYDRDSAFEQQLIKNRKSVSGTGDKILFLYTRGMTTRNICKAFKELYDIDVSASLISKVTNAILEQVVEWQSRPLDQVHPITYLNCVVIIRQNNHVINKAIYLVETTHSALYCKRLAKDTSRIVDSFDKLILGTLSGSHHEKNTAAMG